MPGKNSGLCHSCRSKAHFFAECPIKVRCPTCNQGFQKWFEVERATANKGKFFKCCSLKCGFWEWCKEGESSGKAKDVVVMFPKPDPIDSVDDMSRMFQSQVRLNDEQELHISVNVTIQTGNSSTEWNTKGKGPA
ncbi:uncharacterized protein LOC111376775 [Olea europaea var. sylvestris]|uniref:uncharacterized protein LOC111376775 n=1 Tax=Olea europaea var. sylvestris TaxID=158386 RepID=UPI000C1D3E84|nr:uncharacterized protein LOC111376775 [Olea europaea var. sylvestris]